MCVEIDMVVCWRVGGTCRCVLCVHMGCECKRRLSIGVGVGGCVREFIHVVCEHLHDVLTSTVPQRLE